MVDVFEDFKWEWSPFDRGFLVRGFNLQFGLHLLLPILFAFVFNYVFQLPLIGWLGSFLVLGVFDIIRMSKCRNYSHLFWLFMGCGVVGLWGYDWSHYWWVAVGVIVLGFEALFWNDRYERPESMGVYEFTGKRLGFWGMLTSFVFGTFNFLLVELIVLLESLKAYYAYLLYGLYLVIGGGVVALVLWGVVYLHTLRPGIREPLLPQGEVLDEPEPYDTEKKPRGRPKKLKEE